MSFLKKNIDNISERAEKYSKHVNDYNAISRFMNSRIAEVKLTDIQQKMLERYQLVYNQLVSGKYNEKSIRTQLVEMYSISEVQAYKDIQNTKELFGTNINIEKQFLIRMDLERLDISIRKCIETNNTEAHAKLQAVRTNLIKLLPEKQERLVDDFQVPMVIAQFDPALMGVPNVTTPELEELLLRLKKDYGHNEDLGFIDIEHEDLNNDK